MIFDRIEIVAVFLVYCRVGPVIMLAPGFSQPQIPGRIRGVLSLFVALALTQHAREFGHLEAKAPDEIILGAAREFSIGLAIGLAGRCMMASLETFAAYISASIGLTMNIGIVVGTESQTPVIGTVMTLLATALIFAGNLHLRFIEALADTYSFVSPHDGVSVFDADYFVRALSRGFEICFGLAAPFFLAAFSVNMTLVIMARLLPQLQIFALSGPALIALGLALLVFRG